MYFYYINKNPYIEALNAFIACSWAESSSSCIMIGIQNWTPQQLLGNSYNQLQWNVFVYAFYFRIGCGRDKLKLWFLLALNRWWQEPKWSVLDREWIRNLLWHMIDDNVKFKWQLSHKGNDATMAGPGRLTWLIFISWQIPDHPMFTLEL